MYCAARRRFRVEQLLDRLAVAQPVGDRGDVIHAVDVGIEHRVGAVLANLFNAAMQVADDALGAQNFFAVQFEDDAQHAVRRRMLRPHVEHQLGRVEEGFVLGIEVEIIEFCCVAHSYRCALRCSLFAVRSSPFAQVEPPFRAASQVALHISSRL